MDTINDYELLIIIQNVRLAIDYQHKKVKDGKYADEDEAADVEEALIQDDLVLGRLEALYAQRRSTNGKMPPLNEVPRIDL